MESRVTIKIPRELYRQLSRLVAGTGFSSVTEFMVFVMRTLVSDRGMTAEDRLMADEVKQIRERLRKLGYLEEET
jgi:Arc/MetJ-type ribon-helix-helix transcriptional regulator